VDDRTIKVEYENVGLICFKCGRIGHSKELCKEGEEEQNRAADMPDIGGEVTVMGRIPLALGCKSLMVGMVETMLGSKIW
jgi:hypothetical protein